MFRKCNNNQCSGKVTVVCNCTRPPGYFCDLHFPGHMRTPGKHISEYIVAAFTQDQKADLLSKLLQINDDLQVFENKIVREAKESISCINEEISKAQKNIRDLQVIVLKLIKGRGLREDKEWVATTTRLTQINRDLQVFNSDLLKYSEKSYNISRKPELIPNKAGYIPEIEVKYASNFSEGQIELTEAQNSDYSMHLITIRNTTHYRWNSLSLLMPQIGSIIQSNINLKPLETINLELDYHFEEIQSLGVISMKVLLGRITISNEVFISRIMLRDLKQNGNVYELHAKNQGMVINDCKIYWAGKDGQWRNLNTQFPNFSSRRIAIQGLIRGEEYVFLAYNRENLAISPQLSFVA